MFNLNFKIFSTNVEDDLPHKTRAMEIKELPKYLGVNVTGSKTLSLCNVGAETPSPENSQFPWLKMDDNGNPIGWYLYVNSVWTPVPVGGIIGGSAAAPLAVYPTPAAFPSQNMIVTSMSPFIFYAAGGLPPYKWQFSNATQYITRVVSGTNDSTLSLTSTAANPSESSSCTVILSDSGGATPVQFAVITNYA